MKNLIFTLFILFVSANICWSQAPSPYRTATLIFVKGKSVETTYMEDGYIRLLDGTKLVGEYKLKIVAGDTSEITFKGANGKTTYDRSQLSGFQLAMTDGRVPTFKEAKKWGSTSEIKNQEGFVRLVDGSIVWGKMDILIEKEQVYCLLIKDEKTGLEKQIEGRDIKASYWGEKMENGTFYKGEYMLNGAETYTRSKIAYRTIDGDNVGMYAKDDTGNKILYGLDELVYSNFDVKTRDQAFQGVLVLKDGSQQKGKITIKRVNNRPDVYLVKTSGGKIEVPAANVDFYTSTWAPFPKKFQNPAKNYWDGYLITKSGQKVEGKIALKPANPLNLSFYYSDILFTPDQFELFNYTSNDADLVVQIINGKEVFYDVYDWGFLERISEGELTLYRNPFPTTEAGFLNSMTSMATAAVIEEVGEAVITKQLENDIDEANDLEDVVVAADKAYTNAQVVGELSASAQEGDPGFKKKEYLVKTPDGEMVAVSAENDKETLAALFGGCQWFDRMPDSARRSMLRFSNIEESVITYNRQCNN